MPRGRLEIMILLVRGGQGRQIIHPESESELRAAKPDLPKRNAEGLSTYKKPPKKYFLKEKPLDGETLIAPQNRRPAARLPRGRFKAPPSQHDPVSKREPGSNSV